MHGFCVAAGGTLCNDRGLLTRLIFDVCMYTRYIYSGKYRRGSVSVRACLGVVRARECARRHAAGIHSEIVSCCADGSRSSPPAAKRHENIASRSTCIHTPLPPSSRARNEVTRGGSILFDFLPGETVCRADFERSRRH